MAEAAVAEKRSLRQIAHRDNVPQYTAGQRTRVASGQCRFDYALFRAVLITSTPSGSLLSTPTHTPNPLRHQHGADLTAVHVICVRRREREAQPRY